jgi:hypothetical protein
MFPLFAQDKNEAERHISDHCPFLLNGQWRGGEPPDIAIVGIGQIDPKGDHRLAEVFRSGKKAIEDTYLAKAVPELEKAKKTVEDYSLPYFGDVSNRIYPTLFLPQTLTGGRIKDPLIAEGYKTLISQLDELNSRMVVIDWDHLRSIEEVTVIAGGNFKREALWTLLLSDCITSMDEWNHKNLVYELWTDSETAQLLIGAWDAFSKRDDGEELWEWYMKMSRHLFVSSSKAKSAPASS